MTQPCVSGEVIFDADIACGVDVIWRKCRVDGPLAIAGIYGDASDGNGQ
jgi:hypothetical protein